MKQLAYFFLPCIIHCITRVSFTWFTVIYSWVKGCLTGVNLAHVAKGSSDFSTFVYLDQLASTSLNEASNEVIEVQNSSNSAEMFGLNFFVLPTNLFMLLINNFYTDNCQIRFLLFVCVPLVVEVSKITLYTWELILFYLYFIYMLGNYNNRLKMLELRFLISKNAATKH